MKKQKEVIVEKVDYVQKLFDYLLDHDPELYFRVYHNTFIDPKTSLVTKDTLNEKFLDRIGIKDRHLSIGVMLGYMFRWSPSIEGSKFWHDKREEYNQIIINHL